MTIECEESDQPPHSQVLLSTQILGDDGEDCDDGNAQMDHKPESTLKSGELDSFSRLYYDGLQ